MSMLSNLDLIRRVPLFSMLTADQAQGIADAVVKRRFRRGELVVEQGRKSNSLFILLNGRARVLTADTRGREVILAVLESGDYVGEMSLIDNEPHSATVRSEIQTDMLVLARADFARCLPEHSTLSYGILRGLVKRTQGPRIVHNNVAVIRTGLVTRRPFFRILAPFGLGCRGGRVAK